jgi:hypothetical protein
MERVIKIMFIMVVLALLGNVTAVAGYGPNNLEPTLYPHMLTPNGNPSTLDVFTDVLFWDDGIPYQHFNGLHNFALATRFMPIAEFELQGMLLHLNGTGPITITLLEDFYNGIVHNPGTVIWEITAIYDPGLEFWDEISFPNSPDPWTVFDANEWFWLRITSEGPPNAPWEIYDVAPSLPVDNYSKTYFNLSQPIPDPSPGDNFIRAGGEYTGLWDLAVTAITHNGYFILNQNPAVSVCQAILTNTGDIPSPLTGETATVTCMLYSEQGESSTLEAQQTHTITNPIPPGGFEIHDFTWNVDDDDRYYYVISVEYTRDENEDNDSKSIEFQVYSPPAWLGYVDYGTYYGASFTVLPDGAFAMRFDPGLGTSAFWIDHVSIENLQIWQSPFASGAQIKVIEEVGGVPGAVLWTASDANPATGWNEYPVAVQTDGPFYVAYYFLGTTTSLLRFDDPLKSNQAWIKSSTGWDPDPNAYDWNMRADISVPADFNLSIVPPTGSGLYIPPEGGNLVWDLTVTNLLSIPYTADIWWYVMQDGVVMLQALIEDNYTFEPNEIYNATISAPIPASPLLVGALDMHSTVGEVYPTLPGYEDGFFTFYKTVSGGGNEETTMPTERPGICGQGGMLQIPVDYSLSQNCPNPFNPTTTISLGLPHSDHVNLAVFDLQGRLVETLVNGEFEAGVHQVTFDASGLATGMYIYHLQTTDFTKTMKMVLVK